MGIALRLLDFKNYSMREVHMMFEDRHPRGKAHSVHETKPGEICGQPLRPCLCLVQKFGYSKREWAHACMHACGGGGISKLHLMDHCLESCKHETR